MFSPEVSKNVTFRMWRNVPQACCSGWVILSVTSLLSSSADLRIVGRNCWRPVKQGKLFLLWRAYSVLFFQYIGDVYKNIHVYIYNMAWILLTGRVTYSNGYYTRDVWYIWRKLKPVLCLSLYLPLAPVD
jgi:hypothetical protein